MACRVLRQELCPRIWVVAPADPRRTPESELPKSLTTSFMHMADEYFTTTDDMLKALRSTFGK